MEDSYLTELVSLSSKYMKDTKCAAMPGASHHAQLSVLDASAHRNEAELLQNSLRVVFEKLEAVIGGHTTVLDFLATRNDESLNGKLYSLSDVSNAIEIELISLLMNFLESHSASAQTRMPSILALNEIMSENRRKRRDHNKVCNFIIFFVIRCSQSFAYQYFELSSQYFVCPWFPKRKCRKFCMRWKTH